jgi:hypothetical protein
LSKLDVESDVEVEMFSSDDDEVKGVRFNDSEDERTTALEDGFKMVEVEASTNGTNRVTINNKSVRIKMCGWYGEWSCTRFCFDGWERKESRRRKR